MNAAPWQTGRLALSLTTQPGQFLADGCTVFVEIDGQPWPRTFGNHLFDLAPGNHQVRVRYEYMLTKNGSPAAIVVPIWAGYDTFVRYQTGFFVFSAGTMQVLGQQPFPAR
jgi:hypothetical protein